jgi:linoleoyl-CoA desaturase
MKVTFHSPTDFTKALRARVDAHLAEQDAAAIRRRMIGKTVAVLLWTLGSYLVLVLWATQWWQAVLACLSLGLALAAIGMAIQHDANHGSYPVGPRARRLLGFALDIVGGSSYIWRYQHNVNHHAYTNVAGADADIDLGKLARLSPAQPRLRHHRFQYIYIWIFYSLLAFSWVTYADWRDLLRGRIGENAFPPPRGWDLAGFLLGKLLSLVFWVGIPLLFRPLGLVLLFAFATLLVLGLTLAVVFQLAHVVEDVELPKLAGNPARATSEWTVHQLSTTADFAPNNRVLSWFLGGLNYQIEHHLFPRVCHLHYPALAEIVAQTCREFGVPYTVYPSFRAALGAHARLLRQMGRPPLPAST